MCFQRSRICLAPPELESFLDPRSMTFSPSGTEDLSDLEKTDLFIAKTSAVTNQ
jgi:hypothetical protein